MATKKTKRIFFKTVRASGNLGGISFYLPNDVKWEIKEDEGGSLCLLPTKK